MCAMHCVKSRKAITSVDHNRSCFHITAAPAAKNGALSMRDRDRRDKISFKSSDWGYYVETRLQVNGKMRHTSVLEISL